MSKTEELDPLSSEAMCIKHNIKGGHKKPPPPPVATPPANLRGSWRVCFEAGEEGGPVESPPSPQSPPRAESSVGSDCSGSQPG